MNRAVRKIAIVVGCLIAGGLILPRFVNVNSFRPKLESQLTAALGRQVTIGNLSFSIFSGSVSADNISIADDAAFGKEPFLKAKQFQAGVKVMPLIFSKKLLVTGITLEEPEITLLRGAGGNWNFSGIGGGTAAPAAPQGEAAKSGAGLSIDRLNVDGGRILVGTANSPDKLSVYEQVNLEVSNFSPSAQFPLSLTGTLPGGGDFSVKGKCGPISAGNLGATPYQAAMAIRKLDLAASGMVAAATGIQGMADFEGAINSDGQQVKAAGEIKADKLKLAAKGAPAKRMVAVTYAVEHNVKTDGGTLTQGDVAIGKAVAHLTGTYQKQAQTTTLNMKLNGSDMAVDELEAMLPAIGVVLPSGSKLQGGALTADLAIAGTTNNMTVTGPIRLSNAKLAGFDLGSKLNAIPGLSGQRSGGKDTTIQNFSTTVLAAPESTRANAINVSISSLGVVTGEGTVSPSGALNFEMKAELSRGGVPFSIQGTTASPKFVPNVKAMAGGAAKEAISEKVTGGKVAGRVGRLKN